jgi:Zn-dependent protease
MISTQSGSLRLFRFAGIQVYLHWTWFVVALIELTTRAGAYDSPWWNIAEYLGLFVIVLLHEFGHSLACRQTGGAAEEIILWPFGGIAFVNAPQRPGAQLWSVAAGPLVNVVLAPVLLGATWLSFSLGLNQTLPDFVRLLEILLLINLYLMAFNLLPIYPLDGGQILRSLLWFGIGRARSLWVAAVIGMIGLVAFVGYAIWRQSLWLGFMALFLGQQCWNGLKQARALRALERLPRHRGFACPSCHQAPPGGPMWLCRACRNGFDPFSTGGICPHCQTPQEATTCAHCGEAHPITRWSTSPRWPEKGAPGPVIDV